jgi:multidrug resistance protein, MATE family
MSFSARTTAFWRGEGGGREVLRVSYPLILSQMSFTFQVFVDRLFLTWYGPEAVAGAVTGLLTTWSVIALFIGTGEFLTTFVAQYHGAGRPRRIGPVVWQGVYFSVLAGVVVAALEPISGPVFRAAGHPPDVVQAEVVYSSILMRGAFPVVLMATLSTFFAGRGETRVVLLVNVATTLADTVLNYFWIFGKGGFPRAGVAGAAWSTVVAQALGALIYLVLILRPAHRRDHATLSGWRPERALWGRLLRYGLPTGLQYSMEVLAFGLFMLIVGRLGTAALAASSIAFNLNMIVFLPMLGLGVGVSSLVGRYLGADRPDLAERCTWSAFWMSLGYFAACGAVYVLAPGVLIAPYGAGADPSTFAEVGALTATLLRFVALYSIFDMMNVVFAAGLRGAGDTTYPLLATLVLGWAAMLVPAWLVVERGGGLLGAWVAPTAYVLLLGVLMLRRFRAGRWKGLRVIEPAPADLVPSPASRG